VGVARTLGASGLGIGAVARRTPGDTLSVWLDRTRHRAPVMLASAGAVAGVTAIASATVLSHGLPAQGHGTRLSASAQVSRPLVGVPLQLQSQASASIGAGSRAYRITETRDGARAVNPGQHLRAQFSTFGARISSGRLSFAIRPTAIGSGAVVRRLAPVRPHVRANRISYSYPGVEAWYVNGPAGIEQGFDIPRPLTERAAGPLTLALKLGGARELSLAPGGRSLAIRGVGGPTLHYAGLRASDARGRVLRSWMALEGSHLLLRVDARGAAYPLRVDPLLAQARGSGFGGIFGYSVALSSDGNTALIGAPDGSSGRGDAYVATRSDGSWSVQATLEPPLEYAGPHFGEGLALSGDGNTALIGQPGVFGGAGLVWVFTRSGSTWTRASSFVDNESVNDEGREFARFGSHIALSADGDTALVVSDELAHTEGEGGSWVFTRSGSSFIQQGRALTEGNGNEIFGDAAALSADGSTAIISGSVLNVRTWEEHSWVFTRSGGVLTQQGAELEYGSALALSADGNTALLGFPREHNNGEAQVYARSGETWAPQGGRLIGAGPNGGGHLFGASVALSSDGGTALIGDPGDGFQERRPNYLRGAAWVYTRSGENWSQQGPKLVPAGIEECAEFGYSVALSADATTAIMGAPERKECFGESAGEVYIYSEEPIVTGIKPARGADTGGTSVTITGTNLTRTSAVKFGANAAQSFTVNSDESITATSPPGTGTVDVTVSNPDGTSATGSTDQFHYFHVPPEALPELGRCAASGGEGVYTTSGCVEKSAEGIGAYEWSSGPGSTPSIRAEIPQAILETTGKATVACTSSSLSGGWTASKAGSLTLALAGCHNGAGKSCQTSLTKAGAIELEGALEASLGFIKGGKHPKVGLALTRSGTLAKFTCGELLETEIWTLEGSVIGQITPLNRTKPRFMLLFAAREGRQAVEHLEGGAKATLTAKRVAGGPEKTEQAGLTLRRSPERKTIIAVNGEKLEIKARV
jgi:hypothetical protein